MTTYVILLTFFLGSGQVAERTLKCPTLACVENIRAHTHESRALTRLRVWKSEDFGLLSTGAQPVWPPFIDDQLG